MKPPKRTSLPDRFWNKVSDTPTTNGCWEWTGYRLPGGYGRLQWRKESSWYVEYAHRLMYEDIHGSLDVEIIRHTCDNPPCVNPKHLKGGTQVDNMLDRDSRGNCARAKLSEVTVRRVRRMHATGNYTYTALAKEYGVTMRAMSKVVNRKTWRWVK